MQIETMTVKVRIKTSGENSSESKAAVLLKDRLEKELSPAYKHASGEILIISNVTLFGQQTKDIDLIVIGKLQNFKPKITSIAKDKNKIQLPVCKREAYVNSFCYVIDVKDHSYTGVKKDGLNLLVRYNEK